MNWIKNNKMKTIDARILGMYIGAKVAHSSDRVPFTLIGISEKGNPIIEGDFSGGTHNVCQKSEVEINLIKLLLRPLSDMTGEEAIEVAKTALDIRFNDKYRFGFVGMNDGKDGRANIHSSIFIVEIEKHIPLAGLGWMKMYQIQIDTEDGEIAPVVFSEQGKESRYDVPANQHENTRYLLSRGFDLFSLLPDGLALDAKEVGG
jgi:hypothetical protein